MWMYSAFRSTVLIVFFVLGVSSSHYSHLCDITCPKIVTPPTEPTCENRVFIPWQVAQYRDRIFIVSPRFNPISCATLTEVKVGFNGSCEFIPYPSYKENNAACDGIYSATSVKTDCCGRLWVLDGGADELNGRLCNPKILIYNLQTDTLIYGLDIKREDLTENYQLENLVVDIKGNDCADAYAYVADDEGFSLYVISLKCLTQITKRANCAWTIRAKEFYPDPSDSVFAIDGQRTALAVGLYGLAIARSSCTRADVGCDCLYLHSLSSRDQSRVSTCYVKNFENADTTLNKAQGNVETSTKKRRSQTGGVVITEDGIMFNALIGEKSINCWDTNKPFRWPYFHRLFDDEYFKLPINLAISESGSCYKQNNIDDNLVILSSDYFEFAKRGTLWACSKINSVLVSVPIEHLLKNGKCGK